VTAALRERHAPIAVLMCHPAGYQVLFRESQIMVDLLLRLKCCGIVALPIHDGVVVAEGTEESTRATMLQVFRDHLGYDGVVTVKTGTRAPEPELAVA
jgi:hypothetical protein